MQLKERKNETLEIFQYSGFLDHIKEVLKAMQSSKQTLGTSSLIPDSFVHGVLETGGLTN